MLVLDASAVLPWCFEDERDDASLDLLARVAEAELFVPALFHMEVANVLVRAERRGRISAATRARFTELLGRLRIAIDETTWMRAFQGILDLAGAERLSVYDAAYLDLARRLDVPLATRDNAVKAAAGRLGIDLLPA